MSDTKNEYIAIGKVVLGERSMEDGSYPNATIEMNDAFGGDLENCEDGMMIFGLFGLPPLESPLEVRVTDRGFKRVEFIDEASRSASLQESSGVGMQQVWLGLDEGRRMLLNRTHAAQLLPHLHKFAATGEL